MTIKIGEKIRLLRKKHDITQDKMADYLGITAQAVSRWESGICYPDIEMLPSIANYFSITTDELLCVDTVKNDEKIRDYIKQGQILYENAEFYKAVDLFRIAVKEFPGSFELMLELA